MYNPRILLLSRGLSQPIHFIDERNEAWKGGSHFAQISQESRAIIFKKSMFGGAPKNPLECLKDIKASTYVIFEIMIDKQEVAKTKLKEIPLCPSLSVRLLSNYSPILKERNQLWCSPQSLLRFPVFTYTYLCVCVCMCVVLCNFFHMCRFM